MWSRLKTDSTWGECKWSFWPFHLSGWNLCLLFCFMADHFCKIIGTLLCSSNFDQSWYQNWISGVVLAPYGYLWYHIKVKRYFLLKPKSQFWHLHSSVCLRVQVPYLFLDGVPGWAVVQTKEEQRAVWGFLEETETLLRVTNQLCSLGFITQKENREREEKHYRI